VSSYRWFVFECSVTLHANTKKQHGEQHWDFTNQSILENLRTPDGALVSTGGFRVCLEISTTSADNQRQLSSCNVSTQPSHWYYLGCCCFPGFSTWKCKEWKIVIIRIPIQNRKKHVVLRWGTEVPQILPSEQNLCIFPEVTAGCGTFLSKTRNLYLRHVFLRCEMNRSKAVC